MEWPGKEKEKMNERRCKSFWVSEDALIQVISGKVSIKMNDLPSDFRFTDVREEPGSNGFLLFGRSDEFDRVPVGECAPRAFLLFEVSE